MFLPNFKEESNLAFVFFVLQQLDRSVPSLSTVRKFNLPQIELPQKVYSHVILYIVWGREFSCCVLLLSFQHHNSKGVPFYTNSPKAILKRCIGNPKIATSRARYPTLPIDVVRLALNQYQLSVSSDCTL